MSLTTDFFFCLLLSTLSWCAIFWLRTRGGDTWGNAACCAFGLGQPRVGLALLALALAWMFGAFLQRFLGKAPRGAARREGPPPQRCQLEALNRKLDLGRHVAVAMADRAGHEFVNRYRENRLNRAGAAGEVVQLPRGFWKAFIEGELRRRHTKQMQLKCYRALLEHFRRTSHGEGTATAVRDGERGCAKRRHGGEQNATKARGLDHSLLQWFVDHVQRLRSRSDSTLMLEKAKQMRAWLIDDGWKETDVPKLDGNSGHKWMSRFRKRYGIKKKATGMQLKVAYKKVLRRVKTHLTNIFRINAFWALLFGGDGPKYISLDQKPSWFNNGAKFGTYGREGETAPSVKENFAQSRERYTILTVVPSDMKLDVRGSSRTRWR